MSGGPQGYLSESNLEYLLETVKDVGESLETREALIKKATFLLYNLVSLHPFVNGNKRTGYELVKLFLRLNGHVISSTPEEIFRILVDIATGKLSANDVQRWIATNLIELKPK